MNKNIRWWDFPASALLIAALLSVSLRLDATNWTEFLYLTETTILISAVVGLALGFSRFKPWIVMIIASLYGLFIIPWQLTVLVPKMNTSFTILERLYVLRDRLLTVINQLIQRDQVTDSILFIILMVILFWALGIISSYSLVRRGNAWLALLPAGIVMVFVQSYDPRDASKIWYMASFIFFGLMLVGRVAFMQNNNRWKLNRTALPPSLGLDFIKFTLLTAGIIVILAWTFPALASTLPPMATVVKPIKQSWNEFQERFDNVFSNLNSSVNVKTDYYGSTLTLGQGNVLTDEIIFWVKSDAIVPKSVSLYWKARTYAIYDGSQWLSLPGITKEYFPQEERLQDPQEIGKWRTKFTILSSSFFGTLFSTGQPLWIDRIGKILYVENEDETIDLLSIQTEPLVRPGQDYVIEAELSNPTIKDLRSAGMEYPEWVMERYLQLPANITDRTRVLASELTAGLDNPYDKTVAIINFLRDTEIFEYSETIPPPPTDQEIVDWFIFDSRVGFCNYFASSAIVMLRSQGIPARLAVGYATGEQMKDGSYTVRQRQAHAWPEVYFPSYGWVEFEPTPSLASTDRLPGSEGISSNDNPSNNPDIFRPPLPELMDEEAPFDPNDLENISKPLISFSPAQIILSVTVLFLCLLILVYYYLRSRNMISVKPLPLLLISFMEKTRIKPPKSLKEWADFASLPPLSKAYLEINKALIRLGQSPAVGSTPAERAGYLSTILPEAEPASYKLLKEYQIGLFSTQQPNIIAAYQASGEIRRLSLQKYFNNLWNKLKGFKLYEKKTHKKKYQ